VDLEPEEEHAKTSCRTVGEGFAVVSRERGETKLGCLVLIVLVAILGYLCYRVIPVYLERDGFHDSLLTIAGRATLQGWGNRRIVNRVLQLGVDNNFTVEQKDIQVQHIRGRPEVVLVVNYSRTEEFPGGYVYKFYFRSVAPGSLGF
jgi:hypothetical protein